MDYYLRKRFKQTSATSLNRSSLFKDVKHFNSFYLTDKHWLLILFFFFGIFLIIFYCDARFPTPLTVNDVGNIKRPRSHLFSEERARNFVAELSSLGSKPTGSYENEVLAVDYILRQLIHIKSHSKAVNEIEIDVQKSSGCFPLNFKDGMTSCYRNIKNIVARIGSQQLNSSLLVNCHFDSVPTSPGASDDIVNCAIMLEVLLSLSQHNMPLHHSVIFLFNGAEENILQGSHAFITQHKWANEVIGFINLEACGSGGRQMMFQADESQTWLLEAYVNVAAYPYGSVVAQEIFQSGIIPSDTDFRIFKQFGGLPGLDFAFVKNGYVYHTKYDSLDFINPGAIQQAGENILHTIHQSLASFGERNSRSQQKNELVFFDFLGIFMVAYSTQAANMINIVAISLTIIDIGIKSTRLSGSSSLKMKSIGWAILLLLISLILIVISNISIAMLLGFVNCTMSWYRSPALIASLYGSVSVAIILLLHCYVKNGRNMIPREDWSHEDLYFNASRLLWIIVLCVLQLLGINSSFICSAWVLFPTLIRGFSEHVLQIVGYKGTVKSHLTVHLSMQIIPLTILLYCMWSMYNVFVPIMGRIGAAINPEIPVAFVTAIFVFSASTYVVSLIQVSTSLRNAVAAFSGLAIISCILICFTPIGFPYSSDPNSPAPLRSYFLHTERTFHNTSGLTVSKDSGFWVVPLDYNGHKILAPYINGLKEAQPIDCEGELGCGMPFYFPVVSILRKSFYIPASKPKIHSKQKIQLMSHELINEHLHRLSFQVVGPDHVTLFLSPHDGIKLVEWTLYAGTPLPNLAFHNRQSYFIYYSHGDYTEPWEFSIILEIPKKYVEDAPLIDMSFIAHYLHGHDAITGDFEALLYNLPQFVHATPWTCTLDMYTF